MKKGLIIMAAFLSLSIFPVKQANAQVNPYLYYGVGRDSEVTVITFGGQLDMHIGDTFMITPEVDFIYDFSETIFFAPSLSLSIKLDGLLFAGTGITKWFYKGPTEEEEIVSSEFGLKTSFGIMSSFFKLSFYLTNFFDSFTDHLFVGVNLCFNFIGLY